MVQALNKTYVTHLPSRKTFSTKYLEQVYESTHKDVIDMWRKENNLLMTKGFDGYTDDNNETAINMTDLGLGKTAFDISIDPGKNRENTLWLASQVKNGMKRKSDL